MIKSYDILIIVKVFLLIIFGMVFLFYFLMDTFPFDKDSNLCKYRNPKFFIPRVADFRNYSVFKCQDYWISVYEINELEKINSMMGVT